MFNIEFRATSVHDKLRRIYKSPLRNTRSIYKTTLAPQNLGI